MVQCNVSRSSLPFNMLLLHRCSEFYERSLRIAQQLQNSSGASISTNSTGQSINDSSIKMAESSSIQPAASSTEPTSVCTPCLAADLSAQPSQSAHRVSSNVSNADKPADATNANTSSSTRLYLYGEPMPVALRPLLPAPPLLAQCGSALTSQLLWATATGNCSPLHYDLSDGILIQLTGCKRVSLFPNHPPSRVPLAGTDSATAKSLDPLYPYPLQSAHDRQSQINDIHAADLTQFPLFSQACAQRYSGEVRPFEVLYIPFGWWHQVCSLSKPNLIGVTLAPVW